jgi:predicted membrane channel-forming protein YqfA (hemolysin III family)
VAAIYLPLVGHIALNIGRWMPSKGSLPAWPALAALALIASGLLYVCKWKMDSGVVVPALIAAVIFFGLIDRFRKTTTLSIRWLLLAGLSLAAAAACRPLDVQGRFSGPDSWFQGHSFWHLFTALCLYCLYLYYRSEKDVGLPSISSQPWQIYWSSFVGTVRRLGGGRLLE